MSLTLTEIDWLGSTAAAWAAAVAASIYTGFTIWLTIETRRLRKAQTTPCVVVLFERDSEGCLFLVAKNAGLGVAYDVAFKLYEPYNISAFGPYLGLAGQDNRTQPIADGPFATGIPVLGPGDRTAQFLGHEIPFWEKLEGTVGKIEVCWSELPGGRVVQRSQRLDLRSVDRRMRT